MLATKENFDKLFDYQTKHEFHPFTCPKHSDKALYAKREEHKLVLVCYAADCAYKQYDIPEVPGRPLFNARIINGRGAELICFQEVSREDCKVLEKLVENNRKLGSDNGIVVSGVKR